MGILQSYRLRLKRRRLLIRAFRKRRELRPVTDRTRKIRKSDILLVATLRNEAVRLPYFLKYYRDLGVSHFLIIDNDSDDRSLQYLSNQQDVSVWHTRASYKTARFGVDWQNHLLRRYCHGHWSVVVDPDEFLVYPFSDTRPLRALTDWLDSCGVRSFGSMLLDMYPKGQINAQKYEAGQNPIEIASWFDPGNYSYKRNETYGNLWIQGGPRARAFFEDKPEHAPALNKIPLVKWDRRYAYVSSTHTLLPRGLNLTYEQNGGEKASGILLHAKFLNTFNKKAKEELTRKQHYAEGQEYIAYANRVKENSDMWCPYSEKFINWRQLEILGLMSKGDWA